MKAERLSDERIKELIAAYRERGDMAAREAVILDALSKIEAMILHLRRQRFPHFDAEDMGQKAIVIIIDAVERFGYDRPGSTFQKYVSTAIYRNLPHEVNRDCGPFSLTRAEAEKQGRYMSVARSLRRAGLPDGPREVMDAMGVKPDSKDREWLASMAYASDRSRWLPVGAEGVDPGEPGPPGDREAPGPVRERVESLLSTLPPRWAEIMRRRFGLGCPEELESEVARSMGMTQAGVNYAYHNAMARLRGAAA